MRDLRWVGTDLPGVFDLVDEDGVQRGYYIRPGRKKYQRRSAILDAADHPTEAAARAWVEDRVRGGERGGGRAA